VNVKDLLLTPRRDTPERDIEMTPGMYRALRAMRPGEVLHLMCADLSYCVLDAEDLRHLLDMVAMGQTKRSP
jgi:hypothetical protein